MFSAAVARTFFFDQFAQFAALALVAKKKPAERARKRKNGSLPSARISCNIKDTADEYAALVYAGIDAFEIETMR